MLLSTLSHENKYDVIVIARTSLFSFENDHISFSGTPCFSKH